MKKINLTLLVLLINLCCIAQYKKASYFGKDGRIYGVGTRFYSLGDGIGTRMGYYLTLGKDADGEQWFGSTEFQYLPGYSFELQAPDYSTGGSKTISGTTKASLIFGYNFGYLLLNNDNTDRKIKPYLSAAVNLKFLGGIKESNDDDEDPIGQRFGYSIGGGAGSLFYLKPWLALQAEGGYTYQFKYAANVEESGYNIFPKHPYVRAGLVFRIVSK